MLGDDRLERALLAERGCVFRTNRVEIFLVVALGGSLHLDRIAQTGDFRIQTAGALGDAFEFQGNLAALAAKSVRLQCCGRYLGLQTLFLAPNACQPFLRLSQLVAKVRRSANRLKNLAAKRFLFTFKQSEIDGGVRRFLLAEVVLLLRGRKIRSRGFEQLLVTVAFFFERGEASLSLRQFRFRGRHTRDQLSAAFFVIADASLAAIAFDCNLIETFTILPRLRLDCVAALRTLGVLKLRLLHILGLLANLVAELMNLVSRKALSWSIWLNLLASTIRSLARISSRSLA